MPGKADPEKVLTEAMRLDPAARALVAETLIESLDLDQDFAVSQEWLKEIQRRCVEIDSGHAALLDNAMVINELREKYTP